MKKLILFSLSVLLMFCFGSCSDDKQINSEDNSEINSELSDSDEAVSVSAFPELYSSELREPDFAFPKTLSDAENYMNLPECTDTKKDGLSEKYYSSGILIYEKKYVDNGKLSSVTVYEDDQTTIAELYEYIYDTNGATAIDIDYNENGVTYLRRKLTYHSNGVIKYVYDYATDPESGAPIVNSYEYDSSGNLINVIDSNAFSQYILDALFNQLQGQ